MNVGLQNRNLLVEVNPLGAELQRLVWRGEELLWTGDPAWWTGRSPVLFPIVGALRDDTFRHQNKTYRLPKHGFARTRSWSLVEQGNTRLRFRLQENAATLAAYPFPFRLDQEFTLAEAGLTVTFTLHNPGLERLPASLGAHPALVWPLPGGHREQHTLEFEQDEPSPIRRLQGLLLDEDSHPTPIEGNVLRLRDELFQIDAVILDQLHSRSLRYGAPNSLQIKLTWDFPHLALWTKPGAPFLCLEPWQGYADPDGFWGPFIDKPGVVGLAPGETRCWTYALTIAEP